MANGHVEIHDPFSNHNNLTSSTDCDPKSTSDSNSMDDTVESKLMRVYAKRRRTKKEKDPESPTQDSPVALNGGPHVKEPSSPQTPANIEKEVKEKRKRKKKGWRRLSHIFSCIKPRIEDEEQPQTVANTPDVNSRCNYPAKDEEHEEDELEEIAKRLTEIADEIPFTPPEVESDSPDEDVNVERVIGLLLRDAGDRLNENELKDANIAAELFWNYSFFKRLISTLLVRMGLMPADPHALGPQASPKTQIAVACEVTSRLSAVNTLPMSRMLDHGARYLQDHYSAWAQQNGGYEEAFHSDNEEDEDDK